MFGIGGGELVVIIFAVLLIFGPSRIPEFARVIKRGFQEWTKVRGQVDETITEIRKEIDLTSEIDTPPKIKPSADSAPREKPPAAKVRLETPAADDYLSSPEAESLDETGTDADSGYPELR